VSDRRLLSDQTGKQAAQIWFSNEHGDSTIVADPKRGKTLTYEFEYRGDHGLDFIVERDGDEVVAHHNVAYIATIKWEGK